MRLDAHFNIPWAEKGSTRDGTGKARVSDLNAWMANYGAIATMIGIKGRREGHTMADIKEKLDEASDAIERAHERFSDVKRRFSGNIKNEIASVQASVHKITAEVEKVSASVAALQQIMTSDQMQLAISNAERIAAALKAMSEVEPHKLTFAVIDVAKPGAAS